MVFMDCQMPELDGYETTKRIRAGDAGDRNKNIRIIAMTAHAMRGDEKKCLDTGMDGYISKPVKLADFKNALRTCRQRKSAVG